MTEGIALHCEGCGGSFECPDMPSIHRASWTEQFFLVHSAHRCWQLQDEHLTPVRGSRARHAGPNW